MGYGPEYQRFGVPQMNMSQGPTGLAALLQRPGLRDALLATGSALLQQKDQPGSFGGALGRALPVGMQALQQGQQQSQVDALIGSMPTEMQAMLRTLPPPQRAAALFQLMQPKPEEEYTLGPGEERVRGGNVIARNEPAAPKAADPTDDFMAFLNLTPEQQIKFKEYVAMTHPVGPGVSVNVGEKAQETATGKYWGEKYGQVQDAALAAPAKLEQLNQLEALLGSPGVYQGTGGDTVLNAKRLAKSAGFDVAGVGESEGVQAIGREMALQLRNPAGGAGMPGAMSDKDRQFLESMTPGLGKSPEGNRRIIETQRRIAKRSLEVAEVMRNYAAQHGGSFDGVDTAIRDAFKNSDVFADLRTAPTSSGGVRQTPWR